MMRFKNIFFSALIFLGVLGVVVTLASFIKKDAGAGYKNSSTGEGFAVVELFTSEGCSSCPPAEELIRRLEETSSNEHIYILVFHVDYWDHQGWKDRFSSPQFSERQKAYVNWFNLPYAYTPQIVINGRTQLVGSDEMALKNGIDFASRHTKSGLSFSAGIIGKALQIDHLKLDADENKLDPTKHANESLVLALVQKKAETEVKAGENKGRKLTHVQIVHRLVTLPIGNHSYRLPLPDNFDKQDWEIIGFLQNQHSGEISAAGRTAINKK